MVKASFNRSAQSVRELRSLKDCLAQIDRSIAFRSAFMDSLSPNSGPRPVRVATPLLAPLQDAVALFNQLHIPYAMVGGIAAMVYGRSRFTEDVDFVAAAAHERILAENPQAMRARRFDPTSTWKLYHDSGVEIDIWKDENSDAIAARAREIELEGQTVRIADVHDLVAMKLRAGRLQDDYDVSEILRGTPIDEALLRTRITPEQFSHFESIKARTK
jgi:hypothetical protein